MQCEFEEKQFEQLINIELAEKGQVYPSGQCLEGDIAIDAAVFHGDPAFWQAWRTQRKLMVKPGLYLRKEFWEDAERVLKSNMFPKFRCNLFIQYKRPELISSQRGLEYSFWHEPYWRYEINQHQQDILHKLERRVSAYSIVTYACPCFRTYDELWEFKNGRLVENSNFVKAHQLHGHKKYTFVRAGMNGIACSRPLKIEGVDIFEEIHRMLDQPNQFENNVQFLNNSAKDIRLATKELDEITRKGFFTIQESMGYPEHELGRSITTISAFNLFANTSWGIAFENQPSPPPPPNPIQEVDGRLKGLFDDL